MSVVVVKITDTEIQFAADSQATRGNIVVPCSFTKIKRIGNNVVCGVGDMGWVKQIQVYAEFINNLPLNPRIDNMYEWVFAFYKWQEQNKTPLPEDPYATYLVSSGVEVFHIEYGTVTEVKDYFAIGAGCDIAMTALRLGVDVVTSVDLCCQLNPYCCSPVETITLRKEDVCEKELYVAVREPADAFLAEMINENL